MPSTSSHRDDLIEEDDFLDDAQGATPALAPWRILIADDDVDVHVVTKFALSSCNFQGRPLAFLHAYSGAETLAILQAEPDVALVLLDVTMETPDAGLDVIRQLRQDLNNQLIRIVLRTGQPGNARERDVILNHDIDDYWCKSDLTNRKLFTTVVTALRAYSVMEAAARERALLAAQLSKARRLQALLHPHALIASFDAEGRVLDANELLCSFAGVTLDALLGRPIVKLGGAALDRGTFGVVERALSQEGAWNGQLTPPDANGRGTPLQCAIQRIDEPDGGLHYILVATRA
jgi:PAS domain S-box-containing protein